MLEKSYSTTLNSPAPAKASTQTHKAAKVSLDVSQTVKTAFYRSGLNAEKAQFTIQLQQPVTILMLAREKNVEVTP